MKDLCVLRIEKKWKNVIFVEREPMDSEHRHELKTNELADWLGHLPDFLHNNAKTIIGVVLIIAAAIVFFYSRRTAADSRLDEQAKATTQIEEMDINKMKLAGIIRSDQEPPTAMMNWESSMEIAAGDAKSPNVAALLLIKQGEALRSDLHYKTEQVDAAVAQDHIKKARDSYEKALSMIEDNNTLKAMAEFGLGLCAEEIADYVEAEKIYGKIIADDAYAGTVFGAQAQDRLDNMADNKVQFVFVKAPPPVAPPEVNLQDLIKRMPVEPEKKDSAPVEEITITPNNSPAEEETPDTAVEIEDTTETEEPVKDPEMN